ncbi:MAG: AAA family ATPase [Spirochaetota bacterium]
MNISREALKNFGLLRHPFQGDCQSHEEIYYSPDHGWVKAALEQAARLAGCLVAVVGEVGSGKTTVKNDFIEKAEGEGVAIIQPYMLDKTQLSVQHLEEAIVYGLDPNAKAKLRLSREARNRQLAQMLQASTKAGRRHVLIIEEAQDLSVHVLKVLKRLVEIKAGNRACISVVMIGQPEFLARLDASRSYHLRELIHRTTVAEIAPLQNKTEVHEYLQLKFADCGRVFDEDSYGAILEVLSEAKQQRRWSAAYPLSINNLVAKSLNEAAALGLETINADVIRSMKSAA